MNELANDYLFDDSEFDLTLEASSLDGQCQCESVCPGGDCFCDCDCGADGDPT